MYKYNQVKVGTYIDKLIQKDKRYDNVRQFCKAYLRESNGNEPDDYEVGKMQNRLSQIIHGKKSIQVSDLPIFSKLLDVSCEQILSCGQVYKPIKGHITNYEVAHSNSVKVWEEYINREDKLFLNYDEYGKSVVDYALECKNSAFIKYLRDNDFIRFVDNSEWDRGFTFGLTTCIDRRRNIERQDVWPIAFDMSVPEFLYYEEHLRTQAIALATENRDFEELNYLRARENPAIHNLNIFGQQIENSMIYQRNEWLIATVASSDKDILEYYTEEFVVEDVHKRKNTFIFPYLGNVIEIMIEEKSPFVEMVLQKAIMHNQNVYDKLEKLISEYEKRQFEVTNGKNSYPDVIESNRAFAAKIARWGFRYAKEGDIVSYHYAPQDKQVDGIVTNIVMVRKQSKVASINKLVVKLNDIAEKIIDFGKEQ